MSVGMKVFADEACGSRKDRCQRVDSRGDVAAMMRWTSRLYLVVNVPNFRGYCKKDKASINKSLRRDFDQTFPSRTYCRFSDHR